MAAGELHTDRVRAILDRRRSNLADILLRPFGGFPLHSNPVGRPGIADRMEIPSLGPRTISPLFPSPIIPPPPPAPGPSSQSEYGAGEMRPGFTLPPFVLSPFLNERFCPLHERSEEHTSELQS